MRFRVRGLAPLLWLLLSCPVAAAEPMSAGAQAEKAAIAGIIDDSIGWFADKDFDRLFNALADDADLFIFHPDSKSTIRGAAAFREFSALFRNPDLKYAGHEIRDQRINLSRAGDTAWYSCLLHDCSEFKGRKSCWDDCRWTGVLEKRDGRWVIVQMHFSFAEDTVAAAARQAERDRATPAPGS